MLILQSFLDLINSKDCTHEYNILNCSDLKKVDKTFFKNTKYQSEKKTHLFSKIILVPMSYIYVLYNIIYVLYMYYIICIRYAFASFCWLFLGFWRPRRFLYVFLLAFACFFLGFLSFFASAAIFVCVFAGFCWFFLGF